MKPRRNELLTVRISVAEKKMLAAVAEREGLSQSDVVRLFIRRRHEELFSAPKEK